jgi:hypothetical protein
MTENDHNPAVEHEESDVNIRAIFGFGLGLLAVGVVVHVLVWLLFMSFTAGEHVQAPLQYPLAAADADRLPPEPRLQTAPRQDLIDLRAQEQQRLRTYSWVDRNAGVVRIPIEEAIRLTLDRGLPVRPSPKGKQ